MLTPMYTTLSTTNNHGTACPNVTKKQNWCPCHKSMGCGERVRTLEFVMTEEWFQEAVLTMGASGTSHCVQRWASIEHKIHDALSSHLYMRTHEYM